MASHVREPVRDVSTGPGIRRRAGEDNGRPAPLRRIQVALLCAAVIGTLVGVCLAVGEETAPGNSPVPYYLWQVARGVGVALMLTFAIIIAGQAITDRRRILRGHPSFDWVTPWELWRVRLEGPAHENDAYRARRAAWAAAGGQAGADEFMERSDHLPVTEKGVTSEVEAQRVAERQLARLLELGVLTDRDYRRITGVTRGEVQYVLLVYGGFAIVTAATIGVVLGVRP